MEGKNSFLDFVAGHGGASGKFGTTKFIMPSLGVMTPSNSRLAVKTVHHTVFIGSTTLVVLIALQFSGNLDRNLSDMRGFSWTNLVAASICSMGMTFVTGRFFFKLYKSHQRGGVLSTRGHRLVVVTAFELISQTLNSICYFLPNLLVVVNSGHVSLGTLEWFGVARRSMWNNKFLVFLLRSRMLTPWVPKEKEHSLDGSILLDAPMSHHAFLLIWWVALEVPMIILGSQNIQESVDVRFILAGGECKPPAKNVIHLALVNSILWVYQVSNFVFILRAYRKLQKRPYVLFRNPNIMLRYHFMAALYMMHLILASFVFLHWMNMNSCAGLYISLFGILPAQIVSAVWSMVNGCFMAPVEQRVPEQGFELRMPRLVWKEVDGGEAAAEPSFCFETGVKLWYWSLAAYAYIPGEARCHEPGYPDISFDVAMSLYRLTHHEHIHIKESDMHVLLAWNDRVMLVSFRGTYSAMNVKTDMSFARTPHPPKRGSYWMRKMPLMHRGWLRGWTSKGLDHRMLNSVIRVVHGECFRKGEARLLVTGHSLGGAMAVVAAFDIAKRCGLRSDQISCYTYGAPRVGNHAFVKEYNSLVPDTWQVVNDQDIIPRMPKFLFLYKHAGQRVIINGVGDLIVCPHVVEVSFYHMFRFFTRDSANALGQHSLHKYRKALVAVCEAQCVKNKGLNDGKTAMPELLKKRGMLLSTALNIKPRSLHLLNSVTSGDLDELEQIEEEAV
ncbi:hypothetical protein BSKO_12590 [Bryopsis sp. KO-2023]|nr:hypothetical protein BSKO_12590 [Bryopsis sp. KO-2023]